MTIKYQIYDAVKNAASFFALLYRKFRFIETQRRGYRQIDGSIWTSQRQGFFCVTYEGDYADCNVTDEMRIILSGKTIEQQMEYFYVTELCKFNNMAYGEINRENLQRYEVKLCDYEEVRVLFVKNSILVGAKIDAMWGEEKLFLKKSICTYDAGDNADGGTKECEDYAYLIFIDPGYQGK